MFECVEGGGGGYKSVNLDCRPFPLTFMPIHRTAFLAVRLKE